MTEPTIYDRTGEARRALRDIFDGYGPTGADDARLVNSLLPDLLPGSPPEAKLLAAAASFRVASMLLDRIPAMPPETAVRDVATLLANREAMDARACQWVVGEYALAMGHQLVPTSPPPVPQPPPQQPMQRYGMPVAPPQSSPYSPPPYSPPQSPPYSPPQSPPMSPPYSPPVNPGVPSYPATQADTPPRYSPSPQYAPPGSPQYVMVPMVQVPPPGAPRWSGPGIPGYPVGGPGAGAGSRGRVVSAAFFLGGALFTLISSADQGAPYPAYAFATALVYVIVAVLLFNPRSAAVGEGAAIGAGAVAFANTMTVFDFSDGESSFQHPMAVIAILLVLAATIVALVSRRRLPRGQQVPGWIAIGLISVLLWIISDNVGWISGDGSCCPLSEESGWLFFGDLLQLLLACALLIWAVATGPTLQSVGIYLGIAAASLVSVKFIQLAYYASQESELNWTFAGFLKPLACVALIITALAMSRRAAGAQPPPPWQPGYGPQPGAGPRDPNW